jgi:hypothetical protein
VGKWKAPALPRVALSVCRLFPLKSCGLMIRPRLKRGVCSHPGRLRVGDAYRTAKGERAERFGASYPFLDYGSRY